MHLGDIAAPLPMLPWWPRLRLCGSPLFHGTSTKCADAIMASDRLEVAYPGVPCVSLTRSLKQAVYFAEVSMVTREDRSGAVFVLDGELLRRHYRVIPFRDAVWDTPGEPETTRRMCRDECEEAVWMPISPVSAVSVGVFRHDKRGWLWEPWHSRSAHKQLHLFAALLRTPQDRGSR